MKSNETPWSPYVSIDLETTGLNPETCQILEFGAVIDDWHSPVKELPRFHCYIGPRDGEGFYGSPYALVLNVDILRRFTSDDPLRYSEHELGKKFATWLQTHGIDSAHVNAAGKNFSSFDLQFLKRLPNFSEHIRFRHRAIDPAAFYWRPDQDKALPDTKTCLRRAGFNDHVAHTAIEDCISVIQLIRRGVRKCGLNPV